ncbi:hypothetical protein AB0J68_30375, partial [Micromonospora sp. NPDC049580]
MHPATPPTTDTPVGRHHGTPVPRRRLLRGLLAATVAAPLMFGAAAITLMIDGTGQLDFIDTVRAPGQRAELRL